MATEELDPLIHVPARLRIMTSLASLPPGDALSFNALRDSLGLTVGNLSTHLTKLEGANYLRIQKTFQGRKPATYVQLTEAGQAAFERYLAELRKLLEGLA